MKIGVISDTHIPVTATSLPQRVLESLRGCDLIIHAGDIVDMSLIDKLEEIAQTKAVWGNMDGREVRTKLPEKIVLDVEGKKIGVVHGRGPAAAVIRYVKEAFDEKMDIIIFGHSHTPVNEKKDGTLFFNPGSPTDKVFSPYCSFGIIEIEGGDIRSEIIRLNG